MAGAAVGGAGARALFTVDDAFIKEREALYEKLCEKFPVHLGKTLSSQERDAKGMSQSTLVYGEIKFEPYAIAFQKIRQLYGGLREKGGRFYDIGSGTGKPVFAAALLHDWSTCIGIEILEGLHQASVDLLAEWSSDRMQALLPAPQKDTDIKFILGDVTLIDWSDGDVFFANSTCFDEALMLKVAAVADNMRVGAFGITFTKRLPSAKWKVLENEVYSMSWGSATVYIQQKVLQ